MLKKALLSFGIVLFTGMCFEEILKIGESAVQSIVVFSFYLYCIISLFTYSANKLFYVLSLPFLTQFLHIFQKYSFSTGSNSLWRLLPFIILNIYFIAFFFRKQILLPENLRLFTVTWLIFNSFFLIISPNLENIIWGGLLLYLFTLPFYFCYLNFCAQARDFPEKLEQYLCLLFIIFGLGTFGLIFAAAEYKGSDNLLATRNIADTNVTMAYFILLWPFVLLFSLRKRQNQIYNLALAAIITGVVILSFSRGAVLLVLPYVVLTIFFSRGFIKLKWMVPVIISCIFYFGQIKSFLENQNLLYFWKLRFGGLESLKSLPEKLESLSGRLEIHNSAYSLFSENPLIGHGIGSFEVLGSGFREAHSLWYTLLAEQGILGTVYNLGIFMILLHVLLHLSITNPKYFLLPVGFFFYFVFNQTVGSVFIILPGHSITVNCIAPVLLICLYFYAIHCAKASYFPDQFHPEKL